MFPAPESFVLFGQKNLITRFLFDRHQYKRELQDVVLPIDNIKNIKSMSYDSLHNHIYYTDRSNAIRRVHMNGTGAEIVLMNHNAFVIEDLIVDPYARLLFWTTGVSINVTRLIGKPTSLGSIYHSNSDQPRLLAYHFKKK